MPDLKLIWSIMPVSLSYDNRTVGRQSQAESSTRPVTLTGQVSATTVLGFAATAKWRRATVAPSCAHEACRESHRSCTLRNPSSFPQISTLLSNSPLLQTLSLRPLEPHCLK